MDDRMPARGRAEGWRAAAVAVGLALAALAVGIATGDPGDVIGWRFGDMGASYLHWRTYGFSWMARGVVPWWNTHTFCGAPFAANFETALFYPLNLPFLLMPPVLAVNGSIVLHLSLSAAGTALLATRFGTCTAGAVVAALVYTLSGPFGGRLFAGHLTIVCSLAWFPWLILYIEDTLAGRRSPRWVAAGAVLYALQITAGHPQVLYFGSCLAGVYTLVRLAGTERRMGALASLGGAVLLGAMLAAVPLAITAAYTAEGSREGLTLATAGTFDLPPVHLVGLLVPGYFGVPGRTIYWGAWYGWEVAVYTGIGTLVLVAAGTVWALGRGEGTIRWRALALLVLVILGLAVALGRATPVHGVLFHFVPGFDLFRGPGKILGLLALPVGLLAGMGLHGVMAALGGDKMLRRLILSVGAFVALGVCAAWSPFLTEGLSQSFVRTVADTFHGGGALLELPREALESPEVIAASRSAAMSAVAWAMVRLAVIAIAVGAFAGIPRLRPWLPVTIAALVFADLASSHRNWVTRLDSGSTLLADVAPVYTREERLILVDPTRSPNTALSTGALLLNGYEPVYPRRFGEFMNAWNGRPMGFYTPVPDPLRGSPLAAAAGVGGVLGSEGITDVAGSAPRARLMDRWRVHETEEEAWRALSDGWTSRTLVLVGGDVPPPRERGTPPPPVRLESPTPNELVARWDAPFEGMLYLADTWMTGWRAETGGRELPMLRANHAFRAVPVEEPMREVRFVYTPPGLVGGVFVSMAGLAVLILLVAMRRWPGGGGGLYSEVSGGGGESAAL